MTSQGKGCSYTLSSLTARATCHMSDPCLRYFPVNWYVKDSDFTVQYILGGRIELWGMKMVHEMNSCLWGRFQLQWCCLYTCVPRCSVKTIVSLSEVWIIGEMYCMITNSPVYSNLVKSEKHKTHLYHSTQHTAVVISVATINTIKETYSYWTNKDLTVDTVKFLLLANDHLAFKHPAPVKKAIQPAAVCSVITPTVFEHHLCHRP